MNQLKGTLEAEENKTEPEKDRLKKDEDGIGMDRTYWMDKEQRLGRACSRIMEQEESRRRLKLADKHLRANAREEDLDGRDEALKRLRALRPVERKS